MNYGNIIKGVTMTKTNVVTIEKNVPIPPSKSICKPTTRYNFIKTLEVGDSFAIDGSNPDLKPKNVRGYIYGLKHKSKKNNDGREYAVRTISGTSTNPTAIRVWRVK